MELKTFKDFLAESALDEAENYLTAADALKMCSDAGIDTENLLQKADEEIGNIKPNPKGLYHMTDIQKIVQFYAKEDRPGT